MVMSHQAGTGSQSFKLDKTEKAPTYVASKNTVVGNDDVDVDSQDRVGYITHMLHRARRKNTLTQPNVNAPRQGPWWNTNHM